jgi:hypothetical protein
VCCIPCSLVREKYSAFDSCMSEPVDRVAESYYLTSYLMAGFGLSCYWVTGRDMM